VAQGICEAPVGGVSAPTHERLVDDAALGAMAMSMLTKTRASLFEPVGHRAGPEVAIIRLHRFHKVLRR